MELVWRLRDDPDELGRLIPQGVLRGAYGVPGIVGPTVASPEWWEGIEAAKVEIEGRIAAVDSKAGTFQVEGDPEPGRAYELRGDPDDYVEGFGVRVVASFPPIGFLPGSGNVFWPSDGGVHGVVLEVWMAE